MSIFFYLTSWLNSKLGTSSKVGASYIYYLLPSVLLYRAIYRKAHWTRPKSLQRILDEMHALYASYKSKGRSQVLEKSQGKTWDFFSSFDLRLGLKIKLEFSNSLQPLGLSQISSLPRRWLETWLRTFGVKKMADYLQRLRIARRNLRRDSVSRSY